MLDQLWTNRTNSSTNFWPIGPTLDQPDQHSPKGATNLKEVNIGEKTCYFLNENISDYDLQKVSDKVYIPLEGHNDLYVSSGVLVNKILFLNEYNRSLHTSNDITWKYVHWFNAMLFTVILFVTMYVTYFINQCAHGSVEWIFYSSPLLAFALYPLFGYLMRFVIEGSFTSKIPQIR